MIIVDLRLLRSLRANLDHSKGVSMRIQIANRKLILEAHFFVDSSVIGSVS
ncbi:hypothetical protein SLEP1_g55673 [Rubroshorea leprosula]|uniref:Uncharacterized protein n=1 Tax=Rubroshorea leprosula TaxID=152421 RepID=A0AAV5MH81_9ROSI|nr:hypothetical protein SLEP1_g55673 [Rubroshorea leprosula]